MKKSLIAGVTLAATVLVMPGARAADPDVIHGGCEYATTYGYPNLSDTWTGIQDVHSVTTTGGSMPQPIGATVTCWIEVDGVTAPGTMHSYGDIPGVVGVQAGATPISFTATSLDTVAGCESDAFADGTSNQTICWIWGDNIQLPPQVVDDTVATVVATVDGIVCPPLGVCAQR